MPPGRAHTPESDAPGVKHEAFVLIARSDIFHPLKCRACINPERVMGLYPDNNNRDELFDPPGVVARLPAFFYKHCIPLGCGASIRG